MYSITVEIKISNFIFFSKILDMNILRYEYYMIKISEKKMYKKLGKLSLKYCYILLVFVSKRICAKICTLFRNQSNNLST